jgi:hypothetical protein
MRKRIDANYILLLYATTIHGVLFDPHPSIQVRSYCRGVVVRAVPSETRKKLFERLEVKEMASLRSFLDRPLAKGKTTKGSGQVDYNLHNKNHRSRLVLDGTILHRQVVHAHTYILYLYASFYSLSILISILFTLSVLLISILFTLSVLLISILFTLSVLLISILFVSCDPHNPIFGCRSVTCTTNWAGMRITIPTDGPRSSRGTSPSTAAPGRRVSCATTGPTSAVPLAAVHCAWARFRTSSRSPTHTSTSRGCAAEFASQRCKVSSCLRAFVSTTRDLCARITCGWPR